MAEPWIESAASSIAHTIAVLGPLHKQPPDSVEMRRSIRELERRQTDLQRGLAEEFGRRHGWRLLRRCRFQLGQLARRSNHVTKQEAWQPVYGKWPLTDHAYYYREIERPWRPAAIAAHVYDGAYEPRQEEIAAFAAEHGLSARVVDGFPSWWFPGRTVLVLYTPADRNG